MKALAQEIVAKFSRALRFLGLKVMELTGDMQLSQREIEETHIIVTTPEKWDVITRKSNDLIGLVRLLIFDEVISFFFALFHSVLFGSTSHDILC